MLHGSANYVFVTNEKKLQLCLSVSTSILGVRLCCYGYIVSLADSITNWPWSKMVTPFFFIAIICQLRECLSTCSSAEVPRLSQVANLPSSFITGFSCFMPCSLSRDPMYLVPSFPYYNCCQSYSLSSSFSSLTVHFPKRVCETFNEMIHRFYM